MDINQQWPQLQYDPQQQNIQLPQQPLHINIQEQIERILPEILAPTITKYSILTSNNNKSTPLSRIRAQYDQWDEFGNWINKNTRPKQEFNFKMSSPLPMHTDLRTALLSMSMGDEAWFKVIRNEKIIFYRIKVLEVRQNQVDNSSLQGRMQQLDSFRQIGKGYFIQEMYEQSIKSYRKGLNYLEKWPKLLEEDTECRKSRREYYLIFWGNIAQCHIEMKEFKEAIYILSDLVEQTRNSDYELKNYYRLIKCHNRIEDWENVKRYLNEIKHIRKLNPAEIDEFDLLKKKIKQQ